MAIDKEGQQVRIDYGDRIFFDSVTGIAGVIYPIGTAAMPSSVIANVITLCAARHLNKINVTGTLTIGAGIAQDLVGHNAILTGQTAGAAYVRGFDGYLEIDAMVGGTLDIYADAAVIQINANCTAGTINIYGNARVINNTGGTVVNDYGSGGYAELTGAGTTTGAAYIDALDIDARLYNEFTIKVNNTDGANSLDYRVLLRPEHGVAEEMIQPEDITLAPADYDFVNIDHKWGQVVVQVRDTAAPNHADFTVYTICNKQ